MFGILRMHKGVLAGIAAVGLMIGSTASAATVSFDFTGSGGNTGSTTANYMQGGIDLDVASTGGNINVQSGGLGVQGAPNGGRMGIGESLSFTFTPDVSLLSSVVFEAGNGTDTIRIRDGGGALLTSFVVSNTPGTLFTEDFSGLNLVGDTFVFDVLASTGTAPGVRIRSLQVAAAVPLPATGLLLIAGLGGLAALRRRKVIA